MTTAPTTMMQRKLVDRAWDVQKSLEARVTGIGSGKYGRVLRMARKPTPDEFRKTSIVAAIGIVVLGFLGFTIYYAMEFIPQS